MNMGRKISLTGITLIVVTLLSYGGWRLLSPGGPSVNGEEDTQTDVDQYEGASTTAAAHSTQRRGPSTGRRSAPLQVQAPTFQELRAQAENMSVVELEQELAQLDARIENEDWINRANSDDLSPAERQDFALLLRQKNAVAVVLALRQVEALELDEES
jgi:hypothetical protein